MFSIVNRYLAREVLLSWLVVTAVLLFILLSNQFARVLGDAAAGKLPREAVVSIIGLTSVTYLTVLIPVGLFLAIMLALGRLYRDSEMTAIAACGIGPLRIFRPVAIVSLLLALVLGWVALYAAPWAAARAQVITETARQQVGLGALEAGRFRASGATGIVFYAEGLTRDGELSNVFLQRRRGERVELALAATGDIRTDETTRERVMVLRTGSRYEGVPGTLGFRIIHFAEHGIPISAPGAAGTAEPDREALPTATLLSALTPAHAAEFHWRLSAPVSAVLLSLLAVPLARTNPRQGRYGKLAIGIAVYIVYANLLGAAQVWVEQGVLPTAVGLWPVHAVVVIIAAALLWRQQHLPAPRRWAAA